MVRLVIWDAIAPIMTSVSCEILQSKSRWNINVATVWVDIPPNKNSGIKWEVSNPKGCFVCFFDLYDPCILYKTYFLYTAGGPQIPF